MSFSLVARFLSCKQRPSCAIEGTLPNGISWVTPLLTTALRTELGATLVIGVLTTHHCHNGLLPLPVAPSQDAEMCSTKTSSFPHCPGHRPGPTLLRHWQTKGPDSARLHLNRRATPRLHLVENWPTGVKESNGDFSTTIRVRSLAQGKRPSLAQFS